MAEAVVVSIAESIVAYLVPQALDKVGTPCGVKQELEALKETLVTLQAVLDDAEEKYYQNQNRQIQVWLKKLKDAFYEAQDVLEEFTIEATRGDLSDHNKMCKEVRTFFSSLNQLAFKLKTYCKLRAVRVRIDAIKDDRGFHLDEHTKREWRKREETHSHIHEGDIIGRDDDKIKVKKFLLNSDMKENVSILPIVGIGGLGKTALAKFVHVDSKFDLKMWVYVSTDFDVQKIVKKMLACVKKEEPTEDTMELLQSKLRAEIDGKKYLLVLDDVWNIAREPWLRLKPLLVGGARGSKILVTTRFPLVAEIMGTTPPHLLGRLSESASLELLMQVAGQNIEEIQDSDMLAIGTEIARKCSGVPLVIRTVGSLLFLKKSKLEWSRFKDDELPEVSQTEDHIKSIIKLSYDHLPSHLKQCFAFCSLFPKNYEIKKQTLVDLWMAEGFIQPSNRSQHLEDIGHGYFMDLICRNLLQDFKKDPYTNEETCKMYNLMHDLACLVAGNECLVVRGDMESINERPRHISYGSTFNSRDELPISSLKTSALRTILSTTRYLEEGKQIEERKPTSEADLDQLIQSFPRLRILDLHGTKVENVPRSICKLKHLTYLDLSCNHTLKKLPNSITRLQSLQTLNLHSCYDLEELPSDIRKLVSLRNLDIDGCSKLSYLPRGLGELSSLHRLTHFILPKDKACAKNYCGLEELTPFILRKDKARAKNYCGLGELNGLNNIRGRLVIENLGYVTYEEEEFEDANLIGKDSLKSLVLKWGDFDIDYAVIGERDAALLDRLTPHSNLQELTIDKYEGDCFPRWILDSSSLPNLVEVHLYDCKRCKYLAGLGQLRYLKLLRMRGLTELMLIQLDRATESFPSLLKLEINGCEKLESMPRTPHLEELNVSHANTSLVRYQVPRSPELKRLDIRHVNFLNWSLDGFFDPLTSLESLMITYCHQLAFLSQGMQHLSSLVDLSIEECEELDISKDESGNILDFHGCLLSLRSVEIFHLPKLTSLPQWLLQASRLECLKIWYCDNFTDIPEQIEALQSLQRLEIRCCESLTSLLGGMRGLASLTHLIIANCRNLEALPEPIEALQSLQWLEISGSPFLTSLPEGMLQLTSLTHLQIVDCPVLERRCKTEAGEDWHKIYHIPNIDIRP